MFWKEVAVAYLKYNPEICLQSLRKSHRNPVNSVSVSARHSNRGFDFRNRPYYLLFLWPKPAQGLT
jgi:hypothetical protein